MAIPFNLPSDNEQSSDNVNYQHLDLLLVELYDMLQEILIQRRSTDVPARQTRFRIPRCPSSTQNQREQRSASLQSTDTADSQHCHLSALQNLRARLFSSLTTNTATAPTASSVAGGAATFFTYCSHCFHVQSCCFCFKLRTSGCCEKNDDVKQDNTVKLQWTRIGTNLRQIAEDFHTNENDSGTDEADSGGLKSSEGAPKRSLVSMFFPPAPLSGTLWTAVILVVGWQLWTRSR